MADLIFYKNVVSIDSKVHSKLRIAPVTDYAFAAKTNSVPIVGIEFVEIAREYPIVFIKSAPGTFLPVALLGLRDGENLYINHQGQWNGRYIPAFVRRYPFVPAEAGQGSLVVCIDQDADVVGSKEGELLFDGDQPGPLLTKMLALLQDYQSQAERTKEMCARLAEHDLLVESNAQAELADGTSFRLSGLFVVDESRLMALEKDKLHALFSSGEIGLIYAHLMSLGNLQRLLEGLGQRVNA